MKTIGTVINTIVVVFGMLCSLIAGTFVRYSMAMDNKTKYPSHRPYTSYTYSDNSRYYSGRVSGYRDGWNDCRKTFNTEKEEDFEDNEDGGTT